MIIGQHDIVKNNSHSVLLIQSNTTNGSTTFVDTSKGGSSHTLTAGGNAQHSITISKFGSTAISFDGTGDYVDLGGDSDDWYFPNLVTITGWVYFSSTSSNMNIIGFDNGTNQRGRHVMQWNTSSGIRWYWKDNDSPNGVHVWTGNSPISTGTSGWSTSTWYHIAFCFDGVTGRIFRDGVQLASDTMSGIPVNNVLDDPEMGSLQNGGVQNFNGYLEEFNVIKGQALHTKNFTSPARRS